MDGLISLRQTSKVHPCEKKTCMIDPDHVPVRHVSGSLQFGRVFFDNFTSTIVGRRVLRLLRCMIML
jgi:hypothetical protein